jgi:SpoVK/Ycf46/Vps4 family AAA+-type ATPase
MLPLHAVDLPDAEARHTILKTILREDKLNDDVNLETLAARAKSYSGSDLKSMCTAAANSAMRRQFSAWDRASTVPERVLTMKDFEHALATVGPASPPTSSTMELLRKWNREYGESSDREVTKKTMGF